jgi:hypothetical protein
MNNHDETSNTLIVVGAFGAMFVCLVVATLVIFSTLIARNQLEPPSGGDPQSNGDSVEAAAMLRLLMDLEVPPSNPPAIAERLGGMRNVPLVVGDPVGERSIGSRESFWVTDTESNATSEITATLEYTSEHVHLWVDERVPFDSRAARRMVEMFETVTYPKTHEWLGSEWSPGVDGEERLHILYTRGLGPSVAGLFFSRDEYTSAVHGFSNEHEMFYLSADNVNLDSPYVDSVLAHEFQHMVQWNIDRNEDTWVNEGLSELNELLLGYEPGGFDILFASDPDKPLLIWPNAPGASGAHYGQVFLFLTYLLDRFGADAIQSIAQAPANGLESVDQILSDIGLIEPSTGDPLNADDVFIDWGASLVLQNPDLEDGRYGLSNYPSAPEASISEVINRCRNEERGYQVHQYGIDLISMQCNGEVNLTFTADAIVPVLPTDPHSGDWMMWSNRGDDSNMTLTQRFDLREAAGEITLDYWTWYRIEEDYDQAYLEASVDGGETWQILKTPSSTMNNPTGNSYGWAYNGVSGGGSEPRWINEKVDLSAFAGDQLTLRFEYITDSAVNGEGILIDDLRLSSAGYETDFEVEEDDWLMDGFVRLYNRIPQTFRLALISRGDKTSVTALDFVPGEPLEFPLQFSESVDEFILVVTGTSRYSWIPARYFLRIDPR